MQEQCLLVLRFLCLKKQTQKHNGIVLLKVGVPVQPTPDTTYHAQFTHFTDTDGRRGSVMTVYFFFAVHFSGTVGVQHRSGGGVIGTMSVPVPVPVPVVVVAILPTLMCVVFLFAQKIWVNFHHVF